MNMGKFVTGMITGVIAGVGVSMMINPVDDKDKRRMQKATSKVFTTLGTIADNILDMR